MATIFQREDLNERHFYTGTLTAFSDKKMKFKKETCKTDGQKWKVKRMKFQRGKIGKQKQQNIIFQKKNNHEKKEKEGPFKKKKFPLVDCRQAMLTERGEVSRSESRSRLGGERGSCNGALQDLQVTASNVAASHLRSICCSACLLLPVEGPTPAGTAGLTRLECRFQ